ncbi:MAG: hypothetical protein IJP66_01020 [Kiritimatiellae bacterium]|nr:hypothetical protein [Kiritimatiellia bacterium]
MNSKTFATSIAAAALATSLFAQTAAPFGEDARQALKGAADKVKASLDASAIGNDLALSVFFIEGDSGGYVETLVRDAVLASGRKYVVPNDDDSRLLQKIYSEMAFDERKEGMVSPETVEKINSAALSSTQALIYGNVWTVVDNDRYTLVELSLGAYSIRTKEFLWSGAFDCRHYKPGKAPEIGLVDLPVEMRETLRKAIASKIEESVKAQPKLAAVKTVAILPLVGDESAAVTAAGTLAAPAAGAKGDYVIDGYITHIVVDALSRTSLTPRNADVQSRQEARRALRDKPQVADAILFGAVRGLDFNIVESTPLKNTYEVIVDLQLSIEETSTQNVLWSDTVLERQSYEQKLSAGAIAAQVGQKNIARLVLGVAALLVFLVVFGKVLRAATRVR